MKLVLLFYRKVFFIILILLFCKRTFSTTFYTEQYTKSKNPTRKQQTLRFNEVFEIFSVFSMHNEIMMTLSRHSLLYVVFCFFPDVLFPRRKILNKFLRSLFVGFPGENSLNFFFFLYCLYRFIYSTAIQKSCHPFQGCE